MGANDTRYIASKYFQEGIVDKNTGEYLAGGKVYSWADAARTIPKPLYAKVDDTPGNTYPELPNPAILSSIGTFNYSNIDLHIYTLELNKFQVEDMSHETHPNLSLVTAIYRSMTLPIIFIPECIDDKCYIDGGVISGALILNGVLDFAVMSFRNGEILVFSCGSVWVLNAASLAIRPALRISAAVLMGRFS